VIVDASAFTAWMAAGKIQEASADNLLRIQRCPIGALGAAGTQLIRLALFWSRVLLTA